MSASDRRIIAIDIENMCRKPRLNESDVACTRRRIEEVAEPRPHDLIIIGTSHSSNCAAAGFAWPNAFRAFRRGHNGADLAIIDALKSYDFGAISELLFFGGDGIFADMLGHIAQAGTPVHVFAFTGDISKKMYLTAGYNPAMDVIAL